MALPAQIGGKARHADLPSRLAVAWREYSSKEDRLTLTKDIELLDAISQIFQDKLKVDDLRTWTHKTTGVQVEEEYLLCDKLVEIALARTKIVEVEDKRAAREKQYYTPAELMLVVQAFVMAINEESPDVRERVKTRLAGSAVGSVFRDSDRDGPF